MFVLIQFRKCIVLSIKDKYGFAVWLLLAFQLSEPNAILKTQISHSEKPTLPLEMLVPD